MFYSILLVSTELAGLKEDDIILTINDKFVTGCKDLFRLFDEESVEITFCREGKILTNTVNTIPISDSEPSDRVSWCGAMFEEPPSHIRRVLSKLPSKIFISRILRGSSAEFYGINPSYFITEVNGQEVKTLDDFCKTIKSIPDKTWVKLVCTNATNFIPCTFTIKTHYQYFPTYRIKREVSTREWSKCPL